LSQVTLPDIEAEDLIDDAQVTDGELRVQNMGNFDGRWSNDAQLWWVEAGPGDQLSIPIEVPESGTYELFGFFTRAQDYGVFRIKVNGEVVGFLVDGFSSKVEPTGPISFGEVELEEGAQNIVLEIVGKDARARGYGDGYLVGVDGFLLK